MANEVVIERRFRGPPDSGNGGYSCGLLANFVAPRSAEVTLRLPPPLDRPLSVRAGGGAGATMRDGEALVAEAEPIDGLELELPDPVGVEEAAAARHDSPLHRRHPFAGCFVCGPERGPRDGLGIVCGPIGADLVAAPWEVDDSVPVEDGEVAAEIVWAALDCPGGLSGMLVPEVGTCVLGRLAARIDEPIRPGSACVAVGWPIDREGRKVRAGSAIFSDRGELLAHARATWIELRR
jgi:acyl-coenzyme A thioesterase PaaI-like protein